MFNKVIIKPLKYQYIVYLVMFFLLSGCSLVNWLPSSSCEEVTYQRLKNQVEVYARCKV